VTCLELASQGEGTLERRREENKKDLRVPVVLTIFNALGRSFAFEKISGLSFGVLRNRVARAMTTHKIRPNMSIPGSIGAK
jgi:hypothetical protein